MHSMTLHCIFRRLGGTGLAALVALAATLAWPLGAASTQAVETPLAPDRLTVDCKIGCLPADCIGVAVLDGNLAKMFAQRLPASLEQERSVSEIFTRAVVGVPDTKANRLGGAIVVGIGMRQWLEGLSASVDQSSAAVHRGIMLRTLPTVRAGTPSVLHLWIVGKDTVVVGELDFIRSVIDIAAGAQRGLDAQAALSQTLATVPEDRPLRVAFVVPSEMRDNANMGGCEGVTAWVADEPDRVAYRLGFLFDAPLHAQSATDQVRRWAGMMRDGIRSFAPLVAAALDRAVVEQSDAQVVLTGSLTHEEEQGVIGSLMSLAN